MTEPANLAKKTHSFAPYMKHYGKTPEEQLEKNKPAMELLKQWMAEEVSEEEAQARHEFFEEFKRIFDEFRPEGHKVFTEE
jgi:hypothetical protein